MPAFECGLANGHPTNDLDRRPRRALPRHLRRHRLSADETAILLTERESCEDAQNRDMSNAARIWIAVVLTMAAASPVARSVPRAQEPSPLGDLRVDSMELSDIGSESVEIIVRLAATAGSTATLRNLSFDQLTINDLRVKVPTAPGPVRLRQGEPIEELPLLRATLMYRELESLEPLRRILTDATAQVKTTIRAQLELNLFQRVALMTGGAWVVTRVDQQVPVEIPGGAFGRFAGLAAIAAAEPLWSAGYSMRETRRTGSERAERARAEIARSLVVLETRYDVRSRAAEVTTLRHASTGIVIGKGRVLATAEAIEPWIFDAALAEAIGNGEVAVVVPSLEIRATQPASAASPARTFSLQKQELRVVKTLQKSEKAVSAKTRRRYQVRFRNDDANAALIEIRTLETSPLVPGLPPAAGWRPATVFTLQRQESGLEPVLWHTEARYDAGRFEIKDPLDATAFGAAVWIDNGIAGLLQDHASAVELSRVMKRLPH
jgi:hypothetical protein